MPPSLRPGIIAVMELQGVIGRGVRPDLYLPLFERARKGRRFRALVLSIDSPGGSAAGSEELYLAASRVAAEKPVVACIRNLGASGALYVSSAAHKIVAVRGALVGSIGVMFGRLVAEQALQRLGLAFAIEKTGPHKDMFSPWRSPTPEESQKLRSLLTDPYERFIEIVAKGRRMDPARVREIATGELFSAEHAKRLGLVDELGDMESALDLAAQMAGVKRRVRYLRPKRRLLPLLRGAGFGQEAAQALAEEIELAMIGRLWM
jgi:protease-4